MSAQHLLDELAGLGVGGVSDDDPIAEQALAQARAERAQEDAPDASSSPWRGAQILRRERSAPVSEDADVADAEPVEDTRSARGSSAPRVETVEDDEEDADLVVELLTEIRDLLKLMYKQGGFAPVPMVRRPKPAPAEAQEAVAPEAAAVAAQDEPAASVEPVDPEDARLRVLERRRAQISAQAASTRQARAALIASGHSAEEAVEQLDAERAAEEARAEAEASEDDGVFDDVPMAASGAHPAEVQESRQPSKKSRTDFDVDFDVSSLNGRR